MKTILIAGGAGFIGSHLCDFFVNNNYKVICLDNLITGSFKNIDHLLKKENFKFVKTNIVKEDFFDTVEKIDCIYHLASPASPFDYQKLPIPTLMTNSIGTENLIQLAMLNNCKFVFASTSEVYGDPLIHPQNESYFGNVNPIGPRSMYDESKRFGEALVTAYSHSYIYNVDVNIIRIFNTYGPKMRVNDGRVLPSFICQALTNNDITIFGNGLQTRSFCYIDDLIRALVKLLDCNYSSPINIGNPEEITILDFAKKIVELTNSKSKIIYKSLPQDDPKTRKPDISLANKVLNWKPNIKLEEGLKLSISYFQNILKNLKHIDNKN